MRAFGVVVTVLALAGLAGCSSLSMPTAAKLKALRQAARLGWADVSEGRYTDVADDQLEEFVGRLGHRAAKRAKTAS